MLLAFLVLGVTYSLVTPVFEAPDEHFHFAGRGLLRPGCWADITVFNPETVQDVATYKDPHHYAAGIPYVLVNGVLVIKAGEHTGARAGQALRHASPPRE